tara:strand:+ start:3734 stop:3940 length:207 start_codon:yes stop_codon:yes gene_type:complete
MESNFIRIGDLVVETYDDVLGVVINTVDPTPKYNQGHALVVFIGHVTRWFKWEDLRIISRNPKSYFED